MIPRCHTGAVTGRQRDALRWGSPELTLILRAPDALPAQIPGLGDTGILVNEYGLVAEEARGKDWQSDEGWVVLVKSQDIGGQRQLRNVEFLEAKLAEESSAVSKPNVLTDIHVAYVSSTR
jgi:hypothetical protein